MLYIFTPGITAATPKDGAEDTLDGSKEIAIGQGDGLVPLLNIAILTLVDIKRHSSNIPDKGVYSLIELGYTGEAT